MDENQRKKMLQSLQETFGQADLPPRQPDLSSRNNNASGLTPEQRARIESIINADRQPIRRFDAAPPKFSPPPFEGIKKTLVPPIVDRMENIPAPIEVDDSGMPIDPMIKEKLLNRFK